MPYPTAYHAYSPACLVTHLLAYPPAYPPQASTPSSRAGLPTSIPWRKILSRKEVWAIIVSHFCHNWGTFILLTWMPSYYNQVLGLDLSTSGVLSVLPWVTMAIMSNAGGWIADTLVDRGTSVTTVRKVMQTIGFLGPAVFLSQLSSVTTAPAAVLCMMGAQGLDAFSQSGLYSNHQVGAGVGAGCILGVVEPLRRKGGVVEPLGVEILYSMGRAQMQNHLGEGNLARGGGWVSTSCSLEADCALCLLLL